MQLSSHLLFSHERTRKRWRVICYPWAARGMEGGGLFPGCLWPPKNPSQLRACLIPSWVSGTISRCCWGLLLGSKGSQWEVREPQGPTSPRVLDSGSRKLLSLHLWFFPWNNFLQPHIFKYQSVQESPEELLWWGTSITPHHHHPFLSVAILHQENIHHTTQTTLGLPPQSTWGTQLSIPPARDSSPHPEPCQSPRAFPGLLHSPGLEWTKAQF